jgi:hypothetical protein
MSPIMTIGRLGFLLLIGLTMLAGCGTPNDQASFQGDTQTHVTGWVPAKHATAAKTGIASCKKCHGEDLAGGISGKGCTGCHMGGPTSAHPTVWSGVTITTHGKYVAANRSTACRNIYCHGPYLQGVADSGPSCSLCHNYP